MLVATLLQANESQQQSQSVAKKDSTLLLLFLVLEFNFKQSGKLMWLQILYI